MMRDVIQSRKADYFAGLYGASIFADISLISGSKDEEAKVLVNDGLQSAIAGEELMELWEKDEVVEVEGEQRRKVKPGGSNLNADQCDANGLWWSNLEIVFQKGSPVKWVTWPNGTTQETRALWHMGRSQASHRCIF